MIHQGRACPGLTAGGQRGTSVSWFLVQFGPRLAAGVAVRVVLPRLQRQVCGSSTGTALAAGWGNETSETIRTNAEGSGCPAARDARPVALVIAPWTPLQTAEEEEAPRKGLRHKDPMAPGPRVPLCPSSAPLGGRPAVRRL